MHFVFYIKRLFINVATLAGRHATFASSARRGCHHRGQRRRKRWRERSRLRSHFHAAAGTSSLSRKEPRWGPDGTEIVEPGVFNHFTPSRPCNLFLLRVFGRRVRYMSNEFKGRTRPTRGLTQRKNSPFRCLQVYCVTIPFPLEDRLRMAAGRSTLQQSRLPGGDPRVLRFRAKLIPQHCNRQNLVYGCTVGLQKY